MEVDGMVAMVRWVGRTVESFVFWKPHGVVSALSKLLLLFQARDSRLCNQVQNAFPMVSTVEVWPNNHHAHPQSSRHGLAWFEFDLNWYGITVLSMLGLEWDLKVWSLNSKADAGRDQRVQSAISTVVR